MSTPLRTTAVKLRRQTAADCIDHRRVICAVHQSKSHGESWRGRRHADNVLSMTASVDTVVDYADSVLFGVSSSHNVTRLQRTQNAAARLVVWGSRRRSTNSLCLLEKLHWLPIERRVKFKIACITYKTISTNEPAYLHSLLKRYVPSQFLNEKFILNKVW